MMDSGLTREEYEKAEEEKHKKQNPEDYEKIETYLDNEFKNYVKEKNPHE